MPSPQQETIEFLSRGASYGAPHEVVDQIETHCSIVFLVGAHAYKLKQAVAFGCLDYSTLERRHHACRQEFELNRRAAPELYLDVRRISRSAAGGLEFDGGGDVVEYVVAMRRFDQADLLNRLADARALTMEHMRALADEIAALHARAEVVPALGGADSLRRDAELMRSEQLACEPILDADEVEALYRATLARLGSAGDLLDRRRAQGKVRRCHGDLRLSNICLLEGRPTLFDCIEFSEAAACVDVLYDLAFPLMELHCRGLDGHANTLFNRYLDIANDIDGLAALRLFMSLRASMRAGAFARASQRPAHRPEAREVAALARAYLGVAQAMLHAEPCRLVALGGLSGSVKSAVAYGLAAADAAPGARVIRGDTIRRQLLDVPASERLPAMAYTAEISERVDAAMRDQAVRVLAGGFPVLLDATFLRSDRRSAATAVAQAAGVPFAGVWLGAPLAGGVDPAAWPTIDARRGPAVALAMAQRLTCRDCG